MSFLTKWDPWRELERVSRFFGEEYPRVGAPHEMTLADWAPRVDVKETGEEFVIHAELPGVKKDDVKVTLKDGVLTLKGERKQEKEEKGVRFHRVERAYGSFLRSFTMPEGVDEEKLVAQYKDGILDVHLPKSPAPKTKPVEVKVT